MTSLLEELAAKATVALESPLGTAHVRSRDEVAYASDWTRIYQQAVITRILEHLTIAGTLAGGRNTFPARWPKDFFSRSETAAAGLARSRPQVWSVVPAYCDEAIIHDRVKKER